MRHSQIFVAITLLLVLAPVLEAQSAKTGNPAPTDKDVVLKATEISTSFFPQKIFFRGKVTTVQLRNTGGIHFADDFYFLAGLVDSSGYSASLREKFQAYLLTEVAMEIGGQPLKPGAYGIGFLTGGHFVVMDLGAHDLFQVSSQHDTEIRRPAPLQVVGVPNSSTYRLYCGRDYVEIKRAQ